MSCASSSCLRDFIIKSAVTYTGVGPHSGWSCNPMGYVKLLLEAADDGWQTAETSSLPNIL